MADVAESVVGVHFKLGITETAGFTEMFDEVLGVEEVER